MDIKDPLYWNCYWKTDNLQKDLCETKTKKDKQTKSNKYTKTKKQTQEKQHTTNNSSKTNKENYNNRTPIPPWPTPTLKKNLETTQTCFCCCCFCESRAKTNYKQLIRARLVPLITQAERAWLAFSMTCWRGCAVCRLKLADTAAIPGIQRTPH